MKPHKYACLIIPGLFIFFALLSAHPASAQEKTPTGPDIVSGAQLYDKWYAALGVEPPSGDMPIWSRQSTNSRSGADTWRCSECHGWDYQGSEGAYKAGSHRTGFPNISALVSNLSAQEIVAHLKGSKDPAHDFSKVMDEKALNQLAGFLKFGLIKDSDYIDPISLLVVNADIDHGKDLYQSTCTKCHGEDGKSIVFRSEGIDEYLGSVANRDPWRFLHRTRFGVAGTSMPIGFDLGWGPEDGRDILAYVQTLPTGGQIPVDRPVEISTPIPFDSPGGPASQLFSGILTGLGALFSAAGYSLAFIAGFILVGVLVVTVLKKRK